jgi:hypothetical protein
MPTLPQAAFIPDLFPQILPFVNHLWGLPSLPIHSPYHAVSIPTTLTFKLTLHSCAVADLETGGRVQTFRPVWRYHYH